MFTAIEHSALTIETTYNEKVKDKSLGLDCAPHFVAE